jgi:hypothetical protein
MAAHGHASKRNGPTEREPSERHVEVRPSGLDPVLRRQMTVLPRAATLPAVGA